MPLPGNDVSFSVKVPSCIHYGASAGTIEAEAMRYTTAGGWQHVAWIQKPVSVKTFSAPIFILKWNGKADASLGAGEVEEDEFTHDAFTKPVKRMMQAIQSGKFVTGPFVHIFVRYKPDGGQEEEKSFKMNVAAVVNIVPAKGLTKKLTEKFGPKISYDGIKPVVFQGFANKADAESKLSSRIPQIAGSFYAGCNIVFVWNRKDLGGTLHKTVTISDDVYKNNDPKTDEDIKSAFGLTFSGHNSRNQSPSENITVYPVAVLNEIIRLYAGLGYYKTESNFDIRISEDQLLMIIAMVIVHEVAHSLGLVDSKYQHIDEADKYKCHNRREVGKNYLMDDGGIYTLDMLKIPSSVKSMSDYWRSENIAYIKFLLPTP